MSEVDWWRGEHGDEYTVRNADADIKAREVLWDEILGYLGSKLEDGPSPLPGNISFIKPISMLEIGAGSGGNLEALRRLCRGPLSAIEPNVKARDMLVKAGFDAYDGTAANPGRIADLVFTSGVLIHIPPDELLAACQGIYDAAQRYIVCIEYFSAEPEEKPYQGRKLWRRDFGGFWLDNFDLKVLGNGFAWKRTTGLDDLTWTAFAK